jgi:hypothetical protein
MASKMVVVASDPMKLESDLEMSNVRASRQQRSIHMRSKEKILFLSADHLQEQADARIREAEQLPDGEARQNALKNAAQLRSYANMKRLLAPVPKPKKTTD